MSHIDSGGAYFYSEAAAFAARIVPTAEGPEAGLSKDHNDSL